MERVKYLKPFGAPHVPQIFIFFAAEGGGFAKRGAYGASPPEGDRNPAEGECFASIYIFIYTHIGPIHRADA